MPTAISMHTFVCIYNTYVHSCSYLRLCMCLLNGFIHFGALLLSTLNAQVQCTQHHFVNVLLIAFIVVVIIAVIVVFVLF